MIWIIRWLFNSFVSNESIVYGVKLLKYGLWFGLMLALLRSADCVSFQVQLSHTLRVGIVMISMRVTNNVVAV
jgi:hypothetical protein